MRSMKAKIYFDTNINFYYLFRLDTKYVYRIGSYGFYSIPDIEKAIRTHGIKLDDKEIGMDPDETSSFVFIGEVDLLKSFKEQIPEYFV